MTDPRSRYRQAPERLYGVPDAEHLHDDIASAYEAQIEPYCDDHEGSRIVEEWTVLPHGSAFMAPDRIVEYLCESAADDAPDGFWDNVAHLDQDPVVLAAAEALRTALIERATPYWIADKRVGEHVVTWDEKGEPLVDGQPMYLRRPPSENTDYPAGGGECLT